MVFSTLIDGEHIDLVVDPGSHRLRGQVVFVGCGTKDVHPQKGVRMGVHQRLGLSIGQMDVRHLGGSMGLRGLDDHGGGTSLRGAVHHKKGGSEIGLDGQVQDVPQAMRFRQLDQLRLGQVGQGLTTPLPVHPIDEAHDMKHRWRG